MKHGGRRVANSAIVVVVNSIIAYSLHSRNRRPPSERRRMTYKKIKLYCETHGISIRRFEIMCGLGNGVVDDWREESEPALKSLKKIATATGIPIAEWL